MKRVSDDEFVVSAEELFVLRQALFITKYHLDPAFSEDLQTLTGLDRPQFLELLTRVDELRGR